MSVITLKQKKDLIVSVFGNGAVSSNGDDIAVFCPICEKSPKIKKKRKLSISIETGIYHCWVCEAKGKSLSRFVNKNFPKSKDIEKFKEYFGTYSDFEKEDKKCLSLSLPSDFQLVASSNTRQSRFIKKYLHNRGMSIEDMYRYKVGYSFEDEFKNSAIFPSHDSNLELNFYLSRLCLDSKYRKYKNCEASKKEIIFNEHRVDWSSEVVIVEGIFDALKAGENSIPILGSWIDQNYALFKKIIKEKCDVVLALDLDAQDKQIKIAKNLMSYGINVKVSEPCERDLGDMTKKEAEKFIINAKPFDNIERMRYLISGIKSGSIF